MYCPCTGESTRGFLLPLDVSACLQEPVLNLYMCFFVLPGRICLQGPVLHLCGSVYKAILLHLDVSARLNEQGYFAAPGCVCTSKWTRVCTAPVNGSVRVLFCAAPGHVCLQVPVLYLSLYGMSTRALCCTWTFLSSPWYTWICKVNTQAFRFGSEKPQIELHLRRRQWSRKPIINVPYWPKGGLPAPTAVRKLMILFSDTPSSTAHGYLMVFHKAL